MSGINNGPQAPLKLMNIVVVVAVVVTTIMMILTAVVMMMMRNYRVLSVTTGAWSCAVVPAPCVGSCVKSGC